MKAPYALPTVAFIATVWLGILIGVSFLATPVKFQAPSLSLPVALDVGRVTFALLAKVEWGLCAALLAAVLAARRTVWAGMAGVLAVLLAIQAFWLLPILDQRVGLIIAGQQVAPSHDHVFYIVSDAIKGLALLALCVLALRALASRDDGQEGNT